MLEALELQENEEFRKDKNKTPNSILILCLCASKI